MVVYTKQHIPTEADLGGEFKQNVFDASGSVGSYYKNYTPLILIHLTPQSEGDNTPVLTRAPDPRSSNQRKGGGVTVGPSSYRPPPLSDNICAVLEENESRGITS